MEGLEVWLQLVNIVNILKYEFTPFPNIENGGNHQNCNITALKSNSRAALDLEFKSSKWSGTAFYTTHIHRQVNNAANTNARIVLRNVEWSNCEASTTQDKMVASKGFQWNLLKVVQKMSHMMYSILVCY